MSLASFTTLILQIDLTPLIPLSKQQGKMIFISQYVWRGGDPFERGLRPLYLLFPSPARKGLFIKYGTGWRGVRGEVKLSTECK